MNWLEALILGIIQGLTEFLPVSSSGHLEIGKQILGVQATDGDNMMFSVFVHGATVLSTITVFRKDILDLFKGLFKFKWNDETQFVSKLLISAIPILILSLVAADQIELLFSGNMIIVGSMLLLTATILFLTAFAKPSKTGKVTFGKAILIGIAQMCAIMPGLSRSGSTIATGMLLGVDKKKITRFSFLMVLIPILGASFLELLDIVKEPTAHHINSFPLIIGSLAAFVAGFFACTWMLKLVKKGKLYWFAIYCAVIGSSTLILTFIK